MYNFSIIIVIIILEFMKLFEGSDNILFHEQIERAKNSELMFIIKNKNYPMQFSGKQSKITEQFIHLYPDILELFKY